MVVAVYGAMSRESELAAARRDRATSAVYEALDLIGAEFNANGFNVGAQSGAPPPDIRRLEEARRAIERFADLAENPSDADWLYFLWATVAGNLELARDIIRDTQPNASEARIQVWLASILFNRLDQPKAALAVLNRAVELDPMDAVAQGFFGASLHSDGQNERAASALMRAIELDPGNPFYANALGHVLAESGKPEAAKAQLEALVASGVADAVTHNELGVVYSILQQDEQAAEQFETAARLMPTNALAHANLSYALRRLGRTEEADEAQRAATRGGFSFENERLPIGTLNIPYFFE